MAISSSVSGGKAAIKPLNVKRSWDFNAEYDNQSISGPNETEEMEGHAEASTKTRDDCTFCVTHCFLLDAARGSITDLQHCLAMGSDD